MATTDTIAFEVTGDAIPKQSFRYGNKHGYTPEPVRAWETTVAWKAAEAMTGRAPLTNHLRMKLLFFLGNRRRRDCDNLAKPVLDGCKAGGLYNDDSQIMDLHITKSFTTPAAARVLVSVEEM